MALSTHIASLPLWCRGEGKDIGTADYECLGDARDAFEQFVSKTAGKTGRTHEEVEDEF